MTAQSEPGEASVEMPVGSQTAVQGGVVVRVDGTPLAIPSLCACCMAVAARTTTLLSRGGEAALVRYCEACLRHVSAERTRIMAVSIASVVAGLTAVATLPFIEATRGLWVVATLALLSSLLPVAVGLAWRRRLDSGHVTDGVAVWWFDRDRLACLNPRWARTLARDNGLDHESASLGRPRWSHWYALGPALVLVALPALTMLHTAELRVLNLNSTRLVLVVDGRRWATLEPTSAESPLAGRDLRLPAGEHRLWSIALDGRVLDETVVLLRGGGTHLYAPGAADQCFWLESTHYGRRTTGVPERRILPQQPRFWSLPVDVDTWFAPNPTPVVEDNRSTGGSLTALRQGRCPEGFQHR